MSTAEIYKNVHRAYITPRIGDDLSKLNRKALEYFHVFLANHPAMSQVLRVSPHHIQRVIENDATYTLLTTVPFAVLSPAFTRLEDWKSLANTKTTTATIDSLRAMMPASLAANTSIHLQNLNERYLDVIRAIGQDSVLAEPFLAIDREITAFLCGLSYSQQHALLENTRTLPLFRWRFDSPVFLQELQNGLLTRDSLIHYIMMSGTVPLRMLPRGNRWGDQRYPLGTKEQYGNALMAHGFRASHAKELLSLHAPGTCSSACMAGVRHAEMSPLPSHGYVPTACIGFIRPSFSTSTAARWQSKVTDPKPSSQRSTHMKEPSRTSND
jgi:hypothetical protein